MRKDWQRNTIALLGLAVFAMFALGSVNTGGSSVSSTPPDRRIDAFVMSQEFVRAEIKAPSTAKFPWYDESYVAVLGSNKYRIVAYVDAQNSFGAVIRNNYICEIQDLGDGKWRKIKCVILDR